MSMQEEIENLRALLLDMNIANIRVLDEIKNSVLRCESKSDLKVIADGIEKYISEVSKIIAEI